VALGVHETELLLGMDMQKLAFPRSCSIVLAIVTMSGCGPVHLVQELGYKNDLDKMVVQLKASQLQCKDELQVSELDPIRQKVELYRVMAEKDPPPFTLASNESFPTDSERPIIARWASMRDLCVKRDNAIRATPSSANAKEKLDFQEQMSIGREFSTRVGELILALYQQKLTYGEFAQKQYEFGRDALAAELVLTQAVIERDDDRRAQEEQQAQQQFANVAQSWTDYIQTVNARQPKTINAHIVP
jgi:hypothetical protein